MDKPLNDLMEFDHVIQVHKDGDVTDAPRGIHAPDLYDERIDASGGWEWEFFTYGYTGQDRYNGPIMHNSEFIGGRLERDILANPGIYVAVAAYWSPQDDEDPPYPNESIIEGWAVLQLKD